jgi:hypothetical protein
VRVSPGTNISLLTTHTEIPALLAPTPDNAKKEQTELTDPDDPEAQSEDDSLSRDDGLGAFRPSTSFNDLTTLLPPTAPAPPVAAPSSLPPVVTVSLAPENTAAKKRTLESAPSDVPAPKRRTNASRKGTSSSAASKSKTKAAASGAATQKAAKTKSHSSARGKQYNKNDTPNPLTIGKPRPPTLAAKVPPPKNAMKPVAGHLTGVVTPRLPVTTKEADTKNGAPASPLLSNPPTESDFKSVAQAAVSNLIVNAGNLVKADGASTNVGKDAAIKVDTSTEHIKALTGTNWVSVCSGGDAGSTSSANADKMNNRARRQNLTPDERARQNRDRNREHARNTRLRKKAYVEELKRTLTSLVSQRDAAELEKRHTVQRELEQREVRFRVIEEFLKLRGRNEVNFARWAAILEETFSITLPMADFRSMVQSENSQSSNGFEQVLTGVSETMADSNLLASFIESLSKHGGKEEIVFAYSCDRRNFFMDSCYAVLDWTAFTHGAVKQVRMKIAHSLPLYLNVR